jgi:hypothetical protein
MTTKIQTTENLNTLEAQGAKLGLKWKAIQRSDRKQITDFDLPLGKLMLALEAEASGGQIKKARLVACGINGIDRRRRNDAKHLAANWDELAPMVKRFTSTTALLAAWNKSKKADKVDEPKADEAQENAEGKTSNVGQSDEKPFASPSDIALNLMLQIEVLAEQSKCSKEHAFKMTMLAIKAVAKHLDETKVAA